MLRENISTIETWLRSIPYIINNKRKTANEWMSGFLNARFTFPFAHGIENRTQWHLTERFLRLRSRSRFLFSFIIHSNMQWEFICPHSQVSTCSHCFLMAFENGRAAILLQFFNILRSFLRSSRARANNVIWMFGFFLSFEQRIYCKSFVLNR